ncbi:substrate-binding domain of hmg-CoA reductase [Glonium stellatum]|uniref:hydroxymethylglutaryl-CoA reductase (NADPH) n=1 Tax=Glonium stellatum TaxID=574774 RepID=A0A8E2F144_9PEZI|nr:substrate-binding domain of hmg-CoA reductase [Glonium stellatum]
MGDTADIQAQAEPPASTDRDALLSKFKYTTRHASETSGIKVENCIGFAQVPIGLAGPLTITGSSQNGTFFAPMATVEPTVVASTSRGCKAFHQCGGIKAVALKEAMSRAPLFRFKTVDEAVTFYRVVEKGDLTTGLRATAERTSRHARLARLTPSVIGTSVHVKFDYSCGDAAGQNMATIGTHRACTELLRARGKELGIIDFQLEGQMASDKKLSMGNLKGPRGVQVLAWGVLSDEVCKSVLKIGAERLHSAITNLVEGGIRNGQFGSNVNTSNVIAALFIATGQDAASVLEGGWSHLTSEYDPTTKDLTLSLFIPSLPVGTVGGGTGYYTQREALEMLNCYGAGKKWAFAETIAAFALALDVSTISALGSDTFAQSHQKLARQSKL